MRPGSRAIAVTVCPRRSACRVSARPVRPDAARMVRFMPATLGFRPVNSKCKFVKERFTRKQSARLYSGRSPVLANSNRLATETTWSAKRS